MNRLALITQPKASSGLGRYLEEAFSRQEFAVDIVDAQASKPFKLWPVLKSIRLTSDAMWKARWENLIFCPGAWRRNTKRNGWLLKRIQKPFSILQVGGIYAPCPEFRQTDYCVLACNTTRLSLAEKVKPWVPRPEDREPFIALEQEVYRHARHVFTNAAYVKKHLAEQYGVAEDRMTVTGLGVDRSFLENMAADVASEFKFNLLFVGWDFGYKGGQDLLAAFQIVRRHLPELTLTIVGPDSSQVPPCDGVRLAGAVSSRSDLLAHYRAADLFVMPSLCDSFGFVFLEAMTQGVPCIGTNLNAMPEIIADGETGYVVPLRNPEALAEAILRFYRDPDNRRRMGRAARQRVLARYTWEKVAAAMRPHLFADSD